eukprot:Pompholyxophrys_punicea_v1_NODE_153_length_3174_cov_68.242706.p2 type:complete len:221 gc:universal NODE_153_length_3174_cov_68.242706:1011-349(-)
MLTVAGMVNVAYWISQVLIFIYYFAYRIHFFLDKKHHEVLPRSNEANAETVRKLAQVKKKQDTKVLVGVQNSHSLEILDAALESHLPPPTDNSKDSEEEEEEERDEVIAEDNPASKEADQEKRSEEKKPYSGLTQTEVEDITERKSMGITKTSKSLLVKVFDRETLATSNLTGGGSLKLKRLDPTKIRYCESQFCFFLGLLEGDLLVRKGGEKKKERERE